MRRFVAFGLAVYVIIAAGGPFSGGEPPSLWALYAWITGFLALLFTASYEFVFTEIPLFPLPFRFTILGVVMMNFLLQLSGSLRESLWPAYFLFAVVFSSLSLMRETLLLAALIVAIEASNLLFSGSYDPSRWHRYLGYPLVLAGTAAATSAIVARVMKQTKEVREAHDRLVASADAIDPLEHSSEANPLAPAHRRKANLKTVQEREITFNGLLDMIYGFVPAHTYALFLREQRDGAEVFVLSAIRTESTQIVAPIGTIPDRRLSNLLYVCAGQRQSQNIPDLSAANMSLTSFGYYRSDARLPALQSLLMLPIVEDDSVAAILAVDHLEKKAFSGENQDMLEVFAPFFLQILDKTALTLALKSRADHFNELHNISTDLNSSLKIDEVLAAVIPKIRIIVPFDYCACVTTEEREAVQHLTFAALHGYDEDLRGASFPLESSSVIVHMKKNWLDQGVANKYYTADFGVRGQEIGLFPFKALQKPIRSMYGRLLVSKDKLLGAFFIASLKPDAFTVYHREDLLDTLMNQLSLVAYNSLLYQQIENMARTDGLTGLLNHRTFMEKLNDEYRRLERDERPFSILLMDIDKFKGVNDAYGHPVGDLAIKAVARVLQNTVRGTDFVARYGGEEFAVGMIDTDTRGAAMIAERIRRTMEQTPVTRTADGDLRVTLSIGIVSYPADSRNKADLVGMADEALYHAKRSGRNRVAVHRDVRNASPGQGPA